MGLMADDSRYSTDSFGSSLDSSDGSVPPSPSGLDYDKSPSTASKDLGFSDCPSPLLDSSEKSWPQQPKCQRLLLLRKREGLLNITIRTVELMRKNQQLQQRLTALQEETRAFVKSVLSNPENQGLRLTTTSMFLDKRRRRPNDITAMDVQQDEEDDGDDEDEDTIDSDDNSVEK